MLLAEELNLAILGKLFVRFYFLDLADLVLRKFQFVFAILAGFFMARASTFSSSKSL
jgi:hypothetical protein